MAAVEERIDRLEDALVSLIEESKQIRREIREDIRQIRESNARTDEQLLRMQQQAEKDREQLRRMQDQADRDRDQLVRMQGQADKDREQLLGTQGQAEKDREQLRRMQDQADKDRERADRDRLEAQKERKDFNRRMAELSDSMGMLVEDMVVPNAGRLASEVFGGDPVMDIAPRAERYRGGETMELDLLVAGRSKVMVVESKRRIRPEDPDLFLLKLKRLADFFPEYASHRVIPVLASVRIEPSIVANLTRRKIYGLAFGDETMEFVNLGQFQG